jgi:hypothetical protein
MNIKTIIFTKQNDKQAQLYDVDNAEQFESVLFQKRNPEYLKFLMKYQPVVPFEIPPAAAHKITGYFNVTDTITDSNSINRIVLENIEQAFSIAFHIPDQLFFNVKNIKSNLMSTYIKQMFNQYESGFTKRHRHIYMAITSVDDIENVPEGFIKYDNFDGRNTCFSREAEPASRELFERVVATYENRKVKTAIA